jgi:signal transduction histidine kinase
VVSKDIGAIQHLPADSLAVAHPAPAIRPRFGHLIRINAYWFGRSADWRAIAVQLALENARLQVQLRAQLDQVRQSQARMIEAADNERRRLERDLHDGAQQQLVTLLLSLQLAKA